MASISNSNGRRTIQVSGRDGKRRSIRLGKCDARTADGVVLHVERLLVAQRTGMPLAQETADWLGNINDDLRRRLERAQVAEPRAASLRGMIQLKTMLESYIARRTDLKPWSIKMLCQARDKLVKHFGEARMIGTITAADAADFKRHLGKDSSVAYVAKLVLLARQFFKDAVDSEILHKSPFAKIKAGSQKNPARQRFISRETIDRAIATAVDVEWKLIIALARYGGLRIPSEALALRWSDVLWERGKIVIHASKTEHHVGKGRREIPLFPELKPLLEEAQALATERNGYVITRCRHSTVNLRTQFKRILERAGIEAWPKLFQNLRSSRQTELTETWPAHFVCAWMGNSEAVARDHYLQITDDHFAKAAGVMNGNGEIKSAENSGAKIGAAGAGFGSPLLAPTPEQKMPSNDEAASYVQLLAGANTCKLVNMGAEGFEPSKA
jgi:integrase